MEFPSDPAVVARAREMAARQLDSWGLAELALTAELVVSELVTNAIRHALGPADSGTHPDLRGLRASST
ncbi:MULTISPECIES: ATP-binding protein [unclassified Streptomyces]|uniref:ATP-binding protein n=1 Tax=unclassified Streptomyces TaxID=2593676 RepID=UPI002B1CB91D|nr:ATP-binding protein [Streptomyces sp. NBC_01549]